ncbi:MAG: ATP-grasp domain-containing protein [Nannocystaceae bacterium]
MPTLLLTPRQVEDTRLLRAAAAAAGWEVIRLQGWRPPAAETLRPPIVAYGEPLFVEAVAQALGLAPLQPGLDWLARLPAAYRLRSVEFLTLGRARATPGPAFIKPADDKRFPAQVYADGGAGLPRHAGLDEATPTLVSEPVRWRLEVRCFVAERALRTASIYARDGELARGEAGDFPWTAAERAAAAAFVDRLLADPAVDLPAAVVLDVGEIVGRGWAAVEVNPAYGAGIYGCDPAAALEVIAACFPAQQSQH